MYPLKFENIYFNKVWGGRELELLRDNLPDGNVGESWDVACHSRGKSLVSNGLFKGKDLHELIEEFGQELLGTNIDANWFPLLVKLISAKEKLSVQVHPNDKYSKAVEGEMGKTEAWYIVEAFEGANIVMGTKGCTKEQLREAIEKGTLNQHLNKINVKKGEVYFVKSGLIHAIGEGVILAEIQQNSDTTYRVYDYNRGRDIHLEKALEVVDLNLAAEKSKGITISDNGYDKTYYCLCEHFSLELYDVRREVEEKSDKERFFVFTCVEGEGNIKYNSGCEYIGKGDSILIPATMGSYRLEGRFKLLKSYVPDEDKIRNRILNTIVY